MKNFGYIYKTINLINGMLYIGKREGKFDSTYFGSGFILRRAIKKEGRNKFKIKILAYANSRNSLCILEKQYITDYRELLGKKMLYNIAEGGTGGNMLLGTRRIYNPISNHIRWIKNNEINKYLKNGWILGMDEKTKEKDRLTHLGLKQSIKTRQKRRLAMLGKNKGKKYPQRSGENNSAKRPEVRLKLRIALTGKKLSKKHRKNIGLSMKGKNNGTIWITDTAKNIRVNRQDLQKFLMSGWKLGMTKKKYKLESRLIGRTRTSEVRNSKFEA